MARTVEPISAALERGWDMIEAAVGEMDEAAMASRPNDQSNSVAWLLWHQSRVLDMFIHTRLQNAPQLWVKDSWNEKFDALPTDAEDRGVGWTGEQVAAWSLPSKDVQLAYYLAVKESVRQYLAEVSEDELAREMGNAAIAGAPHHCGLLRTGYLGRPLSRRADRLPEGACTWVWVGTASANPLTVGLIP